MQAQRRNLRKKKENEGALFKSPGPAAYMGSLPSDWPVGPCDPDKSRNSRARDTWRKRWHGDRGGSALSHPITVASLVPRASQNSNPAKSADSRTTCQTEDILCIIIRNSSVKVHSTKTKNGPWRLKSKLVLSPQFIDPEQDILIARRMSRKCSQLLPHSNPDPFGGQ